MAKEDARRWPRIATGLNADQAVAHYAQALLNVPVPQEVSAIGQHAVRVLRGQLREWAQNVIRDQSPGADVEQLMPDEPEQAQPDEPALQPPRFLWQVTDALMAGKYIARIIRSTRGSPAIVTLSVRSSHVSIPWRRNSCRAGENRAMMSTPNLRRKYSRDTRTSFNCKRNSRAICSSRVKAYARSSGSSPRASGA